MKASVIVLSTIITIAILLAVETIFQMAFHAYLALDAISLQLGVTTISLYWGVELLSKALIIFLASWRIGVLTGQAAISIIICMFSMLLCTAAFFVYNIEELNAIDANHTSDYIAATLPSTVQLLILTLIISIIGALIGSKGYKKRPPQRETAASQEGNQYDHIRY